MSEVTARMCAAASATPTHPITKASKSDSKWAALDLANDVCVRVREETGVTNKLSQK